MAEEMITSVTQIVATIRVVASPVLRLVATIRRVEAELIDGGASWRAVNVPRPA